MWEVEQSPRPSGGRPPAGFKEASLRQKERKKTEEIREGKEKGK